MKNIRVQMTEEQYSSVQARAIAEGFPDIESFLRASLGIHQPEIEIFRKLRAAFLALPAGASVRVNQMLPDWNTLPKGERLVAGRMFASAVRHGLIEVGATETGVSWHNTYTRA